MLFVWWVSPRKAVVWQEIAVEEDWASCWAGLLAAVLYSLFLSYPFALSLSLHPLIALFEQGME